MKTDKQIISFSGDFNKLVESALLCPACKWAIKEERRREGNLVNKTNIEGK